MTMRSIGLLPKPLVCAAGPRKGGVGAGYLGMAVLLVRRSSKRARRIRQRGHPRGGVMTPMPNQPKTPVSNFRIPLDLKADAQAEARARGESLTDVVVRALEEYVNRPYAAG
jgi:hypothetical protein